MVRVDGNIWCGDGVGNICILGATVPLAPFRSLALPSSFSHSCHTWLCLSPLLSQKTGKLVKNLANKDARIYNLLLVEDRVWYAAVPLSPLSWPFLLL